MARFGSSNLGTGAGMLRLSNGTLRWGAGNTADISRRADGVTARTVRFDTGGATFDTNGNEVTLASSVGNSGTGSFTKAGTGTLVLAAAPTYSGNTTVSAGTLGLTSAALADSSDISVADGAILHLDFTGTIDGIPHHAGTWGSLTSGATYKTPRITGNGLLYVAGGLPTFDHWVSLFGLTGDAAHPEADPEQDGVGNVLEWVLGGNPAGKDGAGLQPAFSREGGNLTLRFRRSDDSEEDEDIELSVEYGANWGSWSEVEIGASSAVTGGVTVTVVENGDAPDDITVQIPVGTNSAMFARIRAVED